jgi:protein involved in polysaccharide export with SLBB domain
VKRHRSVRVVGHVTEPEIVAHEGVRQAEDGDADDCDGAVRAEPRGLKRSQAAGGAGLQRHHQGVRRRDHDREQQRAAEEGKRGPHGAISRGSLAAGDRWASNSGPRAPRVGPARGARPFLLQGPVSGPKKGAW